MGKLFWLIAGLILIPLLLCSSEKREMSREDSTKLSKLYHATYKTRNPDEIDSLANQILSITNNLSENIQVKALIVHAYSTKGLAADIRKAKNQAIDNLSKAAEKLPELKKSEFYIPLAYDIYFVFHHANLDDPVQAEYWLIKLESLIDKALNEPEYKNGTAEYRRYLRCKYTENIITKTEFLMEQKKRPDEAEQLLSSQLKKIETWFGEEPAPCLMYGYDLASMLSFQQKKESTGCFYAEKCISLAVKFDLLPKYCDLLFYKSMMRQKKYQQALDCCLAILKLKPINSRRMIEGKKKLLINAAAACRAMNQLRKEKEYLSQAEKLNFLPETNISK